MRYEAIYFVPPAGAISHKDFPNNRLIIFDNEAERDAYFGANFPSNTKEIYTARLYELLNKAMEEALQTKGYPSLFMPLILVANGAANARVTRAKKALKWYAETVELANAHLATVGATTNLDPQAFIDSLSLPQI
jgi:hypothetical protein